MFSSELELGNFLSSTDVISKACDALLKTYSDDPKFDFSVVFKHHENPTDFDVLAFICSPDRNTKFLHGEDKDLVSSQKFKVVDFICTNENPSFSINRAAVNLYEPLINELSPIEDQLIKKPLVITGHALGGYAATLFALRLHNIIDEKESDGSKKTKRPLCITFGSPLVGDDAFVQAILERPQWKSCFLNVVLKMDPMPRLLLSSDHKYKPFGAYLFCTESGGFACFEEKDSILGVLDAVNSSSVEDVEMEVYGKVLIRLKKNVLYKGTSELGEFDFNSLRAGITLQLLEIGVLTIQEDNSKNVLVREMEAKAKQAGNKKNVWEPKKKLNEMKISLAYLEWYMKVCASKGGYYDNYKTALTNYYKEIERHEVIVVNHRKLNQYWKSFVENKLRSPQKEGANLRKSWLYGGNTYRKMVEPLDIAVFYKNGPQSTDYMTQRSEHYKLLEKWFDEDKKLQNEPKGKKNKAGGGLSEDSCFWARVEEALLSLKNVKNTMTKEIEEQKLEDFEKYVMDSINEYALSTDVFLEGSSFIKWWREYEKYKGSSYDSEFARYMKKGSYKLYK